MKISKGLILILSFLVASIKAEVKCAQESSTTCVIQHETILQNEHFKIRKNFSYPTVHLLIYDSEMTEIPAAIFSNYPEIIFFSSANTSLKKILPENFNNCKNLNNIGLMEGFLTVIKDLTFTTCENLKNLQLENQKITSIENDAFVGLKNLLNLFLSGNLLVSLNPNLFTPLLKLTSITLQQNQLTSLDANLFRSNLDLTVISLDSNRLTELPPNLFQFQKKIGSLSISFNALTTVQTYNSQYFEAIGSQLKSINITDKTEFVTVRDNQISRIFCANTTLSVKRFYAKCNFLTNFICIRNMLNLNDLDVSNNSLIRPPQKVFEKLINLKTISMHGQKRMQKIAPKVFASSKNLLTIQVDRLMAYKNLRQLFPLLVFISLSTANFTCAQTENISDILATQKIRLNYNHMKDKFLCNITQPTY